MTATIPLWSDGQTPTAWPGAEALRQKVDVVVVGGGLAGLAAAWFLAEEGTRVTVLEAGPAIGGGAAARSPGHLVFGTLEHPWRLRAAMGEAATEVVRFSRESVAMAYAAADSAPTGGLWVAADAAEAPHIEQSAAALAAMGVAAEVLDPARVAATLGTDRFGPGLLVPEEGLVDPAALLRLVEQRAGAAGAKVHVRTAVTAIEQEDRGVVVRVGDAYIVCDAVILAASVGLPALHPWFADKITPVREQVLATRPVAASWPYALRSQQGYMTWRRAPSGGIVLSGARWATPHLEEGEREDRVVPAIQHKLEGFLAERFPALGTPEVSHRWSYVTARTCDGLPILGPIPGTVRYLACTGWNGNDLGFALRGARAVADGLLRGRADGVPPSLRAGRFV